MAKLFLSLLVSLFSALLFFAANFSPAEARSDAPSLFDSAPDRVRILDFENGSAEALLFLELDKSMGGILDRKPAWQSLDNRSAEDLAALADAAATGAYDLVVTGDEAFVRELENRGALLSKTPLFRSELILLGPPDGAKNFAGEKAAGIMKKLFSAGKLFFTPMDNAWISARERALWREAGVPSPGENISYVESGRDGLSLLIQVEEEAGYTLATAGTFAQYLTSTREPEPLEKLAGTGVYRTHYLCLTDNKGLRAKRAENAAKLMAWLSGENAAKVIDGFSLAGIKPFASAGKTGGSP